MTSSRTSSGARPANWAPLFVWAAVLVLFGFLQTSDALSVRGLGLLLLLTFAGGLTTIVRAQQRGFWSPAALFYLVLSVFHAGLAPYWIFGWDPGFIRTSDYSWFEGATTERIIWLVLYGMAAFVLGTLLPRRVGRERTEQSTEPVAAKNLDKLLARGGALVLAGGLALWLVRVISAGGAQALFGSYSAFRVETSGAGLSTAYTLIGLGLGLSMLDSRDRLVRVSTAAFIAFAAVAFFLGLRGEVLFPIAVGVSVRAARRSMPSGRVIAIGVVVVLALISGAQSVRSVGVSQYDLDTAQFNPLGGIAELGTTVRVVAYTVSWHDLNDEPLAHGATYGVALSRAFESVVSPEKRPSAASDFRLFNSEISARAGNIGGSIIGEAFHNFGLAGVLIILLLVGLVMSSFGSARGPMGLAVYVCVAVPLFNHIRNSFVPVLPTVLLALVIVILIRAGQRRAAVVEASR